MKKRIIAGSVAVLTAVCMAISSFAATSVSFYVHDSRVVGTINYHDATGVFDFDSVTASTSSSYAMDLVTANVTIEYGDDSEHSKTKGSTTRNYISNYATATVSSNTKNGFRGAGYHFAQHATYNASETTTVSW